MFDGCENLKTIEIGTNINATDYFITDYSYMFNNCTSLERIDLNNIRGSIVNNSMKYMFNNCLNLTSIDLSNLDVS